jgi:polar amino acid transport system substrate-binding protein
MMDRQRKETAEGRVGLLNVLLVATLAIPLAACRATPPSSQAHADTLEKVRATKELNVGYFIYEPTIMEDPRTGKLSGVFIDMIESIAKSLDARVIYHKETLANFVAGLQSGEFGLSIGATFATPQRATAVLFTRPIFYAGYTGVVVKGRAKQFPTWQSMDRAGLRVAVLQGSAVDDFVRVNFKSAKVVRLPGGDLTLPLVAVSAGQADTGLVNQLTVLLYLRAHPELEEVLAKDPIAPTNFSWAVRPDDIRWLLYLNTCLEYLENTGETYSYEGKYGIPLLHMKQELVFPGMSSPDYWKLRSTGETR